VRGKDSKKTVILTAFIGVKEEKFAGDAFSLTDY